MLIPFSLRRPIALTGAIAVALALLAPLAPARAATVTYSLVLPTAATANPLATSTAGAGVTMAENVTGTVPFRKSPWDATNSTLDPATAVYSALYNGSGEKTAVSATFDFGGIFNRLSFVWGTPGPTNTVKLFLGGTETLIPTLTGEGALLLSDNGLKSVLVTISGLKFDRMVMGADHRALEFANLQATVVPVPAAGLLLVTALGGLTLMRRRKAA